MATRGLKVAGRDDAAESPVVSRTRALDTYHRLRLDILECRLKPGTRLRAEELCERYEVGISPLREALVRLSADGLALLEEHRGYRVAPVSRADLIDLTNMRIKLECQALADSIRNGDDEWESRLVAAFHRLSKTEAFVDGGRILGQGWEERHNAFHRTLVDACGSPWMLTFRDMLYDHGGRYRRLSVQAPKSTRPANDEHREIFDLVMARDAKRACDVLAKHIQITTDTLLEQGDPELFAEN